MFLIIGKDGQLGRCFKDRLSSDEAIFANHEQCDITDKQNILTFVKNKNISTIINCAAFTNTSKAERAEKELCYKVNVDGVKNLSEVSSELKIPLIHISTDFVFGESGEDFKEADKKSPLNEYGKSKLLGEEEFLKHAYSGAIIRVAYLYSVYGSNIVKTFHHLLTTKDTVKVVNDQTISITSAASLAELVLGMLKTKAFDDKEIYHFAASGNLTLFDLAQFIATDKNSSCEIVPILLRDYESEIKRSKRTVLNCDKIVKDFSVNRVSWKEEVRECLKNLSS